MKIEPEISSVSVVMSGKFNPAIFTPAWFALHGILPKRAANEAELEIAHQELTIFSTEWLRLLVDRNRFQAQTQTDPYIRLRDFILRVFDEHLNHTPIEAIGINREVHFELKNLAERDRIGKLLAPVEPWGKWKDELELDSEYGGMTLLTMSHNRLQGGSVNITVQPSPRIPNSRSGIYVHINNHYAINIDDIEGRARLMSFLKNRFENSIQRSNDIIDHIMSL